MRNVVLVETNFYLLLVPTCKFIAILFFYASQTSVPDLHFERRYQLRSNNHHHSKSKFASRRGSKAVGHIAGRRVLFAFHQSHTFCKTCCIFMAKKI